jgi:hypothetical protein
MEDLGKRIMAVWQGHRAALSLPGLDTSDGLDRAGAYCQPARMNRDEEHLRLLSIFHYVLSGLTALMACFPIIHLTFGLALVLAPKFFTDDKGGAPPAFLGWFLVIFAATFILLGWTLALMIFLNGRFLARRRHHTFCLVMAGVECIFIPFGTVLGVFTILVLERISVRQLFGILPRQTG